MLKHLHIRNFTLIDELDIDFHSGFSVITGETGAGKSIILGAIQLLLGQRADAKLIKNGEKKCVIEATFDLSKYGMESFFTDNEIDFDPADTIVRREVSGNGKSRAFINDTPVSLSVMRDLGGRLIDIHSQHQNLLLQKEDFQLNVLDIMAKDAKLLADYRAAFHAFSEARRALDDFRAQSQKAKENEEFMRFQFAELDKANLVENEENDLEQKSQTLAHTEEIKSAMYDAVNALTEEQTGAVTQAKLASERLGDITEVFPEVKEDAERLDSAYVELKDIAQELETKLEDIDFDPALLDQINNRLDTIYTLEQKFHAASSAELIALREQMKVQLSTIENSDEEIKQLEAATNQAQERCMALARQLTEARKQAAKKVEKEMQSRLVPLGIPKVRFSIAFTPRELTDNGVDKVAFLFSANSSTPLQPISEVASGGEIARVMLSLKAMISNAVQLPTIIFDEIDTGVSGRVAEKMAHMMREMGDGGRQVISITHLPQIAALGTTHYKVSKEDSGEGTVSHMRMLSPQERIEEIAQMLSGSNVTEAAIANAKALLSQSN